jgi:squalene-hopene/tetraprenyl-beta-curcumene cyclase
MSLVDAGEAGSPIVEHGLRFLRLAARADGSWAIDANLATWVTTLSIDALDADRDLDPDDRRRLLAWLLDQQTSERHPFTHARPGAWGWTDLSGSVPDADDTAGALLALWTLGGAAQAGRAACGIEWLLDLQNGDGGIPTFCRGWGALPFDRSAPDLTAHAIRAWCRWRPHVPGPLGDRMDRARRRAVTYLVRTQRADGSWSPLWFGNQHAHGELNLTYGTARVVVALGADGLRETIDVREAYDRGLAWLVGAQMPDGGWGGGAGTPSSVEETGVALQALAGARGAGRSFEMAVARGVEWLIAATDEGRAAPPSPIGLYFARLWYYEELYPVVFALAGLRGAKAV